MLLFVLHTIAMASPPPPAAASQPSTHLRTSRSFLSHNMTSHDIILLLRALQTQDQGAEVLSPRTAPPIPLFLLPDATVHLLSNNRSIHQREGKVPDYLDPLSNDFQRRRNIRRSAAGRARAPVDFRLCHRGLLASSLHGWMGEGLMFPNDRLQRPLVPRTMRRQLMQILDRNSADAATVGRHELCYNIIMLLFIPPPPRPQLGFLGYKHASHLSRPL